MKMQLRNWPALRRNFCKRTQDVKYWVGKSILSNQLILLSLLLFPWYNRYNLFPYSRSRLYQKYIKQAQLSNKMRISVFINKENCKIPTERVLFEFSFSTAVREIKLGSHQKAVEKNVRMRNCLLSWSWLLIFYYYFHLFDLIRIELLRYLSQSILRFYLSY